MIVVKWIYWGRFVYIREASDALAALNGCGYLVTDFMVDRTSSLL